MPFRSTLQIYSVFTLALLAAMSGTMLAQDHPAAPVMVPRHIYSDTANPKAEIAAALTKAQREHKRVLLDFGGDWCGDCQVLDYYMHQSPNKELLDKYYVLVDVNVG